jgi:hypothetical protein
LKFQQLNLFGYQTKHQHNNQKLIS